MQKWHLGPFESQVRSEIWQMPPLEAKHVLRYEEDLCYRELKKKIHKLFPGSQPSTMEKDAGCAQSASPYSKGHL